MALLELLHKYCAWNCLNEGCDYIFTGKDKTECWIHMEHCPFRKSEGSDNEEVQINEREIETEIFKCRSVRMHGSTQQDTAKPNVKVSKDVKNREKDFDEKGNREKISENFHRYQFEETGSFRHLQNQDQYIRRDVIPLHINVPGRQQRTPRGHVTPSIRDLFRM